MSGAKISFKLQAIIALRFFWFYRARKAKLSQISAVKGSLDFPVKFNKCLFFWGIISTGSYGISLHG